MKKLLEIFEFDALEFVDIKGFILLDWPLADDDDDDDIDGVTPEDVFMDEDDDDEEEEEGEAVATF